MATSIQVVGEKIAIINDLDLLLLLHLMVERVRVEVVTYPSLQSAATSWESSLEHFGPGTIDLGLSELITDSSRRTDLLNLLQKIEQRLRASDAFLPSSLINERYRIKGVKFADYPVDRLLLTLNRLRSLIEDQDSTT